MFGTPRFLSSQGEIRVLIRGTTRESKEAAHGFFATSREFDATSANFSAAHRANTVLLRARRAPRLAICECE
jgi:hypothetical protein